MKRLFLFLTVVVIAASVMAESVSVFLSDGRKINGSLISYTEEVLIIEPNTLVKYEKKFSPEEVLYFTIDGVGKCDSKDGKFIFDESTRIIPEEKASVAEVQPNNVLPSNPNEVIGKALKSTGGACIGVGIPSLIAGTILVAYGSTGLDVLPQTVEEAEQQQTKRNCATAGCVLMPFGAALTVVGIPLYVHGKHIAELNFNYTGNGAGVAVNF